MNLQELRNIVNSGAINIAVDDKKQSAVILASNTMLSVEQAAQMCKYLGWLEYRLSPFEILQKTEKFVKGLERHKMFSRLEPGVAESVSITFQNKPCKEYGRTCDRIVIGMPNKTYTIIYNMEDVGAKYVIYNNSAAASCVPLEKCSNLKGVVDFIVG